ncbi:sugar ABC transporter permease [Corynebacterium sp. TAE3-ERU30]|nr:MULTISPECIES: sugar ABC transporter permease [unclassified Corynebacterium]MBV7282256.1 sugar ABC transporter permease [Corynebacterium sp. TAE3-ERU30]MBV7302397.1 sugar ABC transporter permease [Corynebacterium sp. TAE3-ERU2]
MYGWAFLAPFAILFIAIFLVPIFTSIYSSFFLEKSSGGLYGTKELSFVGFENYSTVLHDSRFWHGMGRVILFGAFQIPIMIFGALALALLLDSLAARYIGFYRLAYFLPYAIPGVVAAMVWTYLYNPTLSPIMKGLSAIGIDINLFDTNIVLVSMANMTTWTFTGYNMLIFLAALQSIPHDLYEAARIDGANEWTIVRRIKIPMVKNAALLAVLLSIIGTVQLFNEPTVLATVQPSMGGDYTPMMLAYNTAMGTLSPSGSGPASAISIVMALLSGIMAAVYAVVQRKLDK